MIAHHESHQTVPKPSFDCCLGSIGLTDGEHMSISLGLVTFSNLEDDLMHFFFEVLEVHVVTLN